MSLEFHFTKNTNYFLHSFNVYTIFSRSVTTSWMKGRLSLVSFENLPRFFEPFGYQIVDGNTVCGIWDAGSIDLYHAVFTVVLHTGINTILWPHYILWSSYMQKYTYWNTCCFTIGYFYFSFILIIVWALYWFFWNCIYRFFIYILHIMVVKRTL